MKKLVLALLALAAACALSACGGRNSGVPDLTGEWTQSGGDTFYQIAEITGDTVNVWWYLPEEDTRNLYWSGSFVPPTDRGNSYKWTSENRYTVEELEASHQYDYVAREETKEFTYKDGVLSYYVTAGHLRMIYELKRPE